MIDLNEIYRKAAAAAQEDGIDAGDQDQLVGWIRANCKYRPGTEWFLVLGIGCELASAKCARED